MIVMRVALHAEFRAELADFFFDCFSERIGIEIEAEVFRTTFLDELAQAFHCIAVTDDESAVDGLKIFGERCEGAAEKLLTLGSGPEVGFFPITQKIDRDHGARQRSGVMQ